MQTPHLYRQLIDQLRQWITPHDQRHLQGFAEVVAAILQVLWAKNSGNSRPEYCFRLNQEAISLKFSS